MIRFIRTPQPPYNSTYRAGMVRELGSTLEDIFTGAGDAVTIQPTPAVYPPAKEIVSAGSAWTDVRNPATGGGSSPVTSVEGRIGDVDVLKADVGLGNVDNTSDLNKPISTATQSALDALTSAVATKATAAQGTKADTALQPVGPSAFTSRVLTSADNGAPLICASAQTATVNTGLPTAFGCSFKGAISFAGTATVADVRTTGAANPWCALVQTGANTYDVVGGKA